MEIAFTAEEQSFQDEVRRFLAKELPADISEKVHNGRHLAREDYVRWQKTLFAKGWGSPAWPVEFGGTGWSAVQQHIFEEEAALAGAPRMVPFGLKMVAPVIMKFGNEAQQKRFLPRILSMDDWWCQGYSETGSGSDLASLKTRAVRDGDHYVVTGQKTWTTYAQYANWIFCLVRTRSDGKAQAGISFLLVDMKTPGITVRPIVSIDGTHHLNEVFFDDVKVPVAMRVGEENKGWDVAKYLLGNERTGIARLGRSKERVKTAKEKAKEVMSNGKPLIEDPVFRQRVAQFEVDIKALDITQLRVVSAHDKARDGKPDPLTSVLKIKGTELLQSTTEMVMDVGGPLSMPDWAQELAALSNEPELGPAWATETTRSYLMLRAASIYGGTNEIMKNIVSKAVLGL